MSAVRNRSLFAEALGWSLVHAYKFRTNEIQHFIGQMEEAAGAALKRFGFLRAMSWNPDERPAHRAVLDRLEEVKRQLADITTVLPAKCTTAQRNKALPNLDAVLDANTAPLIEMIYAATRESMMNNYTWSLDYLAIDPRPIARLLHHVYSEYQEPQEEKVCEDFCQQVLYRWDGYGLSWDPSNAHCQGIQAVLVRVARDIGHPHTDAQNWQALRPQDTLAAAFMTLSLEMNRLSGRGDHNNPFDRPTAPEPAVHTLGRPRDRFFPHARSSE
ncbi:hypothetical protein BMF94_3986 [Rhodotorula taiwanensis]|uniref:Uncharacterized protein n=1 Tax=Rhodotorula taiwanensis TaxID=741276 RepID=A0A2S5B897_9BASI|nr:hypothetical protein BMF94_3986 [Rhodotorula taiwanensis]